MRTPRRRTFLTSVPNSQSHSIPPTSRARSFELTFQHAAIVNEQQSRLEEAIASYTERNTNLRQLIDDFRDHPLDSAKRERLSSHFARCLGSYAHSLEVRRAHLHEIEKMTMIFRPADHPVAEPPTVRQSDAYSRRQRLFEDVSSKHKRPRRRPFPPPQLVPPSSRASMLQEHWDLIEKALYLERLILIEKMKLRICHDHRDLAALRLKFEQIEEPEDDECDPDEADLKRRIRNCREQIKREKARIAHERDPDSILNRAAASIQSAWRGFRCRAENRGAPRPPG
jgi:hypothetical protein